MSSAVIQYRIIKGWFAPLSFRSTPPNRKNCAPLDLGDIRLNRRKAAKPREPIHLRAELSRAGVQRCEAELWLAPMLVVREDGSGAIDTDVSRDDISFFTEFFIALGDEAISAEAGGIKGVKVIRRDD